jgi:hypothetical protein
MEFCAFNFAVTSMSMAKALHTEDEKNPKHPEYVAKEVLALFYFSPWPRAARETKSAWFHCKVVLQKLSIFTYKNTIFKFNLKKTVFVDSRVNMQN